MVLKSFVGGHDINVFKNCQFDPLTRKYTGGVEIATIPFSGKMLNVETVKEESSLEFGGVLLPVVLKRKIIHIDPIPDKSECDYCIVSNVFFSACRSMGIDTSRLLTIGDAVVNKEGRLIGCANLNANEQ